MPEQKFEWNVKKDGKLVNHIGTETELRRWARNGQLPPDAVVKRVGHKEPLTKAELKQVLNPPTD